MFIRFARFSRKLSVTFASVVLVTASAALAGGAATKARWTPAERATLASLCESLRGNPQPEYAFWADARSAQVSQSLGLTAATERGSVSMTHRRF